MKPCSKNRKRIALLALDALDLRAAAALRDHLVFCEGCRRYSEEISIVTKRLAAAEPDSNVEASAFFHQRVSEKLQTTESVSVLEHLASWFRGSTLNWRLALPAIAALMIALLAIVLVRHQSAPFPLRRVSIEWCRTPVREATWRQPSPITRSSPVSLWKSWMNC
jgi:hypothetical protein